MAIDIKLLNKMAGRTPTGTHYLTPIWLKLNGGNDRLSARKLHFGPIPYLSALNVKRQLPFEVSVTAGDTGTASGCVPEKEWSKNSQ